MVGVYRAVACHMAVMAQPYRQIAATPQGGKKENMEGTFFQRLLKAGVLREALIHDAWPLIPLKC